MSDGIRDDEESVQPGPDEESDPSTKSDVGLTGGTGAAPGEATVEPTGRNDEDVQGDEE